MKDIFTSSRKEDADLARMDLWISCAIKDDVVDDDAVVVGGGCGAGCCCCWDANGMKVVSDWDMTLVIVKKVY
jgi:hypothetical protein